MVRQAANADKRSVTPTLLSARRALGSQVRSSRQPRLLVVVSASRMLLLLALLLRLLRLPSQLAMQAGAGAV